MLEQKKHFQLFANCIPVKGASRSIICDLQRNTYRFIPNLLYDILQKLQTHSVAEVKAAYHNEYDQGIDQYLGLLTKSEWGFWTNEPNRFPDISLEWNHPALITNAIIDSDAHSTHDYQKIQKELDLLGCKALEMRTYSPVPPTQLHSILRYFQLSRLQHLTITLPFSDEWSVSEITNLVNQFPRIIQLIFHSAPEDKVCKLPIETHASVLFIQKVIDNKHHCGIVHPIYFSPNLSHFTEAQSNNTCLNRKISIDEKGNIKNCPSMPKSYGNHKEISLLNALQKTSFKDSWQINKDQIDTCKDCEFRYICTDCRAYIQNPQNIFSKPKKCHYNPYSAQWESNSKENLQKNTPPSN